MSALITFRRVMKHAERVAKERGETVSAVHLLTAFADSADRVNPATLTVQRILARGPGQESHPRVHWRLSRPRYAPSLRNVVKQEASAGTLSPARALLTLVAAGELQEITTELASAHVDLTRWLEQHVEA